MEGTGSSVRKQLQTEVTARQREILHNTKRLRQKTKPRWKLVYWWKPTEIAGLLRSPNCQSTNSYAFSIASLMLYPHLHYLTTPCACNKTIDSRISVCTAPKTIHHRPHGAKRFGCAVMQQQSYKCLIHCVIQVKLHHAGSREEKWVQISDREWNKKTASLATTEDHWPVTASNTDQCDFH